MTGRSIIIPLMVTIGIGVAVLVVLSSMPSDSLKPKVATQEENVEHIDMTIEGLETIYVPGELIVFSVRMEGFSDSDIVCNRYPPKVVIRDGGGEETVLNPFRLHGAVACTGPEEFDIVFTFGDDEEIALDRPGTYAVVASYESDAGPTAKSEFVVKDDAAIRGFKNRAIMAEAQELFAKQQEEYSKYAQYQSQLENTTTSEERQELEMKMQASLDEIDRIDARLKQLERVNISLYRMEPELEKRLYTAEKVLIDKYTNPDSDSYIGENAVEIVEVDILSRSLVILVNPDKVDSNGRNVPDETEIDGFPVRIEYGKVELL